MTTRRLNSIATLFLTLTKRLEKLEAKIQKEAALNDKEKAKLDAKYDSQVGKLNAVRRDLDAEYRDAITFRENLESMFGRKK